MEIKRETRNKKERDENKGTERGRHEKKRTKRETQKQAREGIPAIERETKG